jgi:hemin uptake protein HemP
MTETERPPSDPPQIPMPSGARLVDSEDLLQGAKTLVIRHAGEYYRLIVTRNDKLVLHK